MSVIDSTRRCCSSLVVARDTLQEIVDFAPDAETVVVAIDEALALAQQLHGSLIGPGRAA